MPPSFQTTLASHDLILSRGKTEIVQINVGRVCNLACKHCHLEAGPNRNEAMTRETMEEVCDFTSRCGFTAADITGGAPELVADLPFLLSSLRERLDRLMLRTNLTLLLRPEHAALLQLCRDLGVALVASFPSTNRSQADSQRGEGVWRQSVDMLKRLNGYGYGVDGSGLELNLVANPAGAFLPADQCQAEKRFRRNLAHRWGISFTNLYTFANVPLGRFRRWLEQSGNLESYAATLHANFNPGTIGGLMCRNLVSVSWDGYLYDCDFNLAAGKPSCGEKMHVSGIDNLLEGTPIITGDYCYACTAGAGFT